MIEWTYACKELYYEKFKKKDRDNSLHTDFLHYSNYWADRLEDTHHGQEYIIE